MTLVVSTSTYYSNIEIIFKLCHTENSCESANRQMLSNLNTEMALNCFSGGDELRRTPFHPEDSYVDKAKKAISSIDDSKVLLWGDSESSLLLDFWNQTAHGAKFLLFYTSPEHELRKYINCQLFSSSMANQVISAWCIRTRAMLEFYLNNRTICLLSNFRFIESNTIELNQLIKERFLIDLEISPDEIETPGKGAVLIDYLATTLLLNNQVVSEIYDEVRSAATIIDKQDKEIADIQVRNDSLITDFISTANAHQELIQVKNEMEGKTTLNQLQMNQMSEELEHYFEQSEKQADINQTLAEYLASDPLLRIARKVRKPA